MGRDKPSKPRKPEPPDRDAEDVVWVGSDLGADGQYLLSMHVGPDLIWPLTPNEAMRHSWAVLAAVAHAEYDAAVMRLLTKTGANPQTAAEFVGRDLRPDRVLPVSPGLLQIVPGVADMDSPRPVLFVEVQGERVGQWTVEDARAHVLATLEASLVVDLDNQLYSVLRSAMDLEENRARNVVADITNHR